LVPIRVFPGLPAQLLSVPPTGCAHAVAHSEERPPEMTDLRTPIIPLETADARSAQWWACAFSVGLALTAFTKLRFGAPIGLGEVLMLGLSAQSLISDRWSPVREVTGVFTRFWFPFLALGLFSSFLAVVLDRAIPFMWYDVIAYSFIALSFVGLVGRTDVIEVVTTISRVYPVMVIPVTFVLYLYSRVSSSLGGILLLDGDYATYGRFQGLTENANQLAFTATIAFIFSLYHFNRTRRLRWLAMSAASVLVGFVTVSDGFRLALVLAVLASVAHYVWAPAATMARAVARIVLLVLCAIGVILTASAAINYASQVTTKDNGQASEREELWSVCLERTFESPIVGNGFGAQATRPGYIQECHNTFLEVMSATGILGLIAAGGLVISLCRAAYRTSWTLSVGVIMTLFQMTFSHFLRHSSFWLLTVTITAVHVSNQRQIRDERLIATPDRSHPRPPFAFEG
jgi:O-antigen ligase